MYDTSLQLFMKKFILLVVFFVCALVVSPSVYASTPSASPSSTMMVQTEQKIEYILPYPGLLPTSPLYFFKNIRDHIIEILISDPVKKAEFYLLQADKKLSMALALSDMKKTDAAKTAYHDAQILREKSIAQLESVKRSGAEVPGFVLGKLSAALDKHLEVGKALHESIEAIQALIARSQKLVGAK